jgi:hypothetical protein
MISKFTIPGKSLDFSTKKSPGSNNETVIAAEDSPSKCIHAVTTKKACNSSVVI